VKGVLAADKHRNLPEHVEAAMAERRAEIMKVVA
jgi:hypothetical protein